MQSIKRIFILLLLFSAASVFAHFQMIYTPESVIPENTAAVDFKLVFTHPFEAGLTMDIGKDESGTIKGMKEFFVVHKGAKSDLTGVLKGITFTSLENSGQGFEFTFGKEQGLKGGGDWVFVAVPEPYYEASEDIYIQQITKVMINKGELSTDWKNRVAEGYPEILPLVKPYDVWTGGVFRGIVVNAKGKPVANAEIEFEYINYDIDMKENKFTGKPVLKKSGAGIILADKQGVFEFIPNRAGYWGFAALGAGGELDFGGKELSQDAVLWFEASGSNMNMSASASDTMGMKKGALSLPALVGVIVLIVLLISVPIVLKKKKKTV